MSATFTAAELGEMNHREMQRLCKAHSLGAGGKSVDLRKKLSDLLEQEEDAPPSPAPLAETTNQGSPAPTRTAMAECEESAISSSEFMCFNASAPPIQASPMKRDDPVEPTTLEPTASADGAAEAQDDAAELPSPIDGPNAFPNDGTFLSLFQKMEQEQAAAPFLTEEQAVRLSLGAFAGLRDGGAVELPAEQPPPPPGSPHALAVERLQQKVATTAEGSTEGAETMDEAEEEVEFQQESDEVEAAIMAARAMAAVRQAEEMLGPTAHAGELTTRTHTKWDDEGNIVHECMETLETHPPSRHATITAAEDGPAEEEAVDVSQELEEMTIMEESLSLPDPSASAQQQHLVHTEWRGEHIHFEESESEEELEHEDVLVVVGRKRDAAPSMRAKKPSAVLVSDSPARPRVDGARASKIVVQEIDAMMGGMAVN
jgi:hypothetical protein